MWKYTSLMAVILASAGAGRTAESGYFVPSHVLPGIGVGRQELSDETLAGRTEAMIQSQTFIIMREPQAMPGAERIFSPRLQRVFRDAEHKSGFPASLLQAIAYLESWGMENAASWAGPRGIMQISGATARRMGLRVSYATRHRVTKTKVASRNKYGKLVNKTVRHKESYIVLVRDDRLKAEKAIPAAAMYLAGMEQHYGGRDWAIWAYHCGEGCVADILRMVRSTSGLDRPQPSVAKVFFGCHPAWNRELCQALHSEMERDYSPTYWFRVMRAEQLLHIYQDDAVEFKDLVDEYRYRAAPLQRAPDRLSVWLKPEDFIYATYDAIHQEQPGKLVSAPADPAFFGYRVRVPGWSEKGNIDTVAGGGGGSRMEPPLTELAASHETPEPVAQTIPSGDKNLNPTIAVLNKPTGGWYLEASPSTLGTLAYIAYETRRLYAAMQPGSNDFVPLDVTALVVPAQARESGENWGPRMSDHSSGQVFDIALAGLSAAERESLRFVLDDLGWNGYLGFIEEQPGKATMHIGCSPSSRSFFGRVFEEEQAAIKSPGTPAAALPAAVVPVAAPVPARPPFPALPVGPP